MIEVYVNSLSVREQFFVAMSLSVTAFTTAVTLRELFKDSHLRMAARVAGIASILPLLSFGWRATSTIEKLQTELVARKHDGTEISRLAVATVYEVEAPSGAKLCWHESNGRRWGRSVSRTAGSVGTGDIRLGTGDEFGDGDFGNFARLRDAKHAAAANGSEKQTSGKDF